MVAYFPQEIADLNGSFTEVEVVAVLYELDTLLDDELCVIYLLSKKIDYLERN